MIGQLNVHQAAGIHACLVVERTRQFSVRTASDASSSQVLPLPVMTELSVSGPSCTIGMYGS